MTYFCGDVGIETDERRSPSTIDQRSGTMVADAAPAIVSERAPQRAIAREIETEFSKPYELSNVVETALARALVLAAGAKRWDVVSQIAEELSRRGSADPDAVRAVRASQDRTRRARVCA